MPLAARSLRFLVAAAAVACVVFLVGLYVDSFWLRLPAKPWPHLVLLAWLLAGEAGAYARRIAAAIALCMVADLLLEFRDTLFVHGMAVFLAAQLTFASAFTMRCRQWHVVAALPFVAWLVAGFARIAPGLGPLQLPVTVYMTAIGLMMWRAAAMAAGAFARGAPSSCGAEKPARRAAVLALAGAIVFGASDTLIALERFHAPVACARYLVIVTYWAALALIAASAVEPSREGRRAVVSPPAANRSR